MIKETATVVLEGGADQPRAVLRELGVVDSSVTISRLPSDALIIKSDCFISPDHVFNGGKGECARADYVIISEKKKCVIYIEMKRTKDSKSHVIKQLTGAHCFIGYCKKIGRLFWEEQLFMKGYAYRFVSIGHTSVSKRKTRVTKDDNVHDTPQKAMKIDWPKDIQYNKLAGM
jgi:hypothetical protein